MNPNKLICTDLDGTLLKDDGTVSQENLDALKLMLDKGNLVYLVTGRPEYFALDIAEKIDPRIKVIAYNGAVYELGDKKMVHHFNKQSLEEILAVLSKYNFKAYFKSESKVYTNDTDNKFDYRKFGVETVFSLEDIQEKEIIKIIVLEEPLREKEFEELIERLEVGYNLSHYIKKGFELSVETVSKGNALKDIMDYYEIAKEDVYVFGDDVNDLSMFNQAHHAIASDNANAYVKMHATYISSDNNDSCVANGLWHLGLMNE